MSRPSIEELHKRVLYPVVRVKAPEAGGSGVLIYSDEDKENPGKFINIVLTCEHVISKAITVKDDWDPVLKRQAKRDFLQEVSVELFDYDGSKVISANATTAEIVAYDKHHDLAALRLHNPRKQDYIASIIPQGEIGNLRLFDPVWTSGCSLLHDCFASPGTLTYLREIIEQKTYLMANAPSIFGNCIAGDSLVALASGAVKPIRDILVGDKIKTILRSRDKAGGSIGSSEVKRVIASGQNPVWKVQTAGTTLRATAAHCLPVITMLVPSLPSADTESIVSAMWLPVTALKPGNMVITLPQPSPTPPTNPYPETLPSDVWYEKIISIEQDGEDETYDLQISDTFNFFADRFCVHNSGGGLFHGDSLHLLGLTSRVTGIQVGFGIDIMTWMQFSTHPERLHEFIQNQELQFLTDSAATYQEGMKRREKRKKEALREILLETKAG